MGSNLGIVEVQEHVDLYLSKELFEVRSSERIKFYPKLTVYEKLLSIYQGNTNVGGSRDATREAFQLQLFLDGKVWMDMIGIRNKTSHTYNEETADEIYRKILNEYYPAFLEFQKNMEIKRSGR